MSGPTPEEIAAARAASSGGPTPEEIAAARKRSDEKLEAMMGSRASNLDRRHIEVGPWEAALLGSATGAPVAGGLVDELSGATYAALAKAKGLDRSGVQFSGSEPEQGVGVGELYRQGRDYARDLQSSAREQHPYAFGIPNVVAGMVSPVPKSLAVTKDASTAARYANAAKLGILEGIGRGTSDLTKGDVTGVLRDAAVGGVTAPAVVGAGDIVGGLAKKANKSLTDTRRLLQEWAWAMRSRQQKILSDADILPDEPGRATVLDSMMTMSSPKNPDEKLLPWFSPVEKNLERALPGPAGPGVKDVAGMAKGALVDELDRGRLMTPGFSLEGIPQKLEREAQKFEAAPSVQNRALAKAFRDEASTFYDQKATQAAQEAENRSVAEAARKARAEFEAFNAAARAKRGESIKSATAEFEKASGAKKAAESDLEKYLAAAKAAKAESVAKAKSGIGAAEDAAERARLSKMVPPVYKSALRGPAPDQEGSRIMEILRAPAPVASRDSLAAIDASREAARAAAKAPIASNPDLEATIAATTGPANEAARKLAEAKAARPEVNLELGAKVRAAEATLPRQVPPVIKAPGSLPGGLSNLKETGFLKSPYDAKMAQLRGENPKEWRSHPEAMAAQAARFHIREGEDAQAAGLAMDSGDFGKFQEVLDRKKDAAVADVLHRAAKTSLDRIRGNNPVGLTATIAGTGAAASSGVIPGILAASGVKALQDYGPGFGANLLYSIEGLPANLMAGAVSRGAEYGAKAAIGPAVGGAAKYMKPKISNFADWLKSKAGDRRDEEEAKAKFKSDAGI